MCGITLADLVVSEIAFSDVLNCVSIVEDCEPRNPFEDSDCFNHELRETDFEHATNVLRNRRRYAIELDSSEYGFFEYARQAGCSKQVAREFEARRLASIREDIARIYGNDWQTFGVVGELNGYSASVYGVDGFGDSRHWEYLETLRHDIAREIVDQLEDSGRFRVVDVPALPSSTARERFERMKELAATFNR